MGLRLIEATPPDDAPMPLTAAVRSRVPVVTAESLRLAYGEDPVFEESVVDDVMGAYAIAAERGEWEERFLQVEFEDCVLFFYYTKDGLFRGRALYEGEGYLEWENKTVDSAASLAGSIVFEEYLGYLEPDNGAG